MSVAVPTQAPRVVVAPFPVRVLLALAAGFMFVYFWTGATLLSWLILPIERFRMRRATELDRIKRCQDIVSAGFVGFIAWMRRLKLIDFDPRAIGAEQPATPSVIVANHPTLIDVTALIAVYPRTCCVAKGILFGSPMVGRLLRYCGHIEGGDEASGMAGAAVMQQAMDRLEQGLSVIIFPEGTRSPPRQLGKFKRGSFEIAIRAKAPVMPVFLSCDPPTLMKGLAWYALPKQTARFTITPLDAVPAEKWEGDSRAAAHHFELLLRSRVRSFYEGRA